MIPLLKHRSLFQSVVGIMKHKNSDYAQHGAQHYSPIDDTPRLFLSTVLIP